MHYSVIRRRGAEETTRQEPEAAAAVRLLRDWSLAYPQQYLLVQDDRGVAVAYRRPAAAAMLDVSTAQRLYS